MQICKKILLRREKTSKYIFKSFKSLTMLSLYTWLDSFFVHNTFFKLYNSNVVGKCSERYKICLLFTLKYLKMSTFRCILHVGLFSPLCTPLAVLRPRRCTVYAPNMYMYICVQYMLLIQKEKIILTILTLTFSEQSISHILVKNWLRVWNIDMELTNFIW